MSAAPIIIAAKCPSCSRFVLPSEIMTFGPHVRMCRGCYEKNRKDIVIVSQQSPPKECAECHASFESLPDVGGVVSMVLVPKDGTLQIVCQPCADRYLPKRADLFKGTAFGRKALNL